MSNVKSFLQTVSLSSSERAARATELSAQLEQHDDEDTKKEYQRTMTHAIYDAKLSGMSEQAAKFVVEQLSVDASKIVAQSRELKKRTIAAAESAASGAPAKDKALRAFIAALKKRKTFTLEQLASIMQHNTTTQASYLKTMLDYFGALESYDKDAKKLTVNKDHALIVALIAAH